MEVDEVTLDSKYRRIFTGWMFAASPGLHGIEHPVYDIWLVDCKGGTEVIAEAEGGPEEPQPLRAAAAPPRRAAAPTDRRSAAGRAAARLAAAPRRPGPGAAAALAALLPDEPAGASTPDR